MNALPSKKVLSILILTVAIVATIILVFGRDTSSKAINFANNLVAGDKVSIPENPNWRAELGNINVNLDQTKETKEEKASSTGETTTDIVSRSLVSNYIALKQNGSLDNVSAQKLIDQTVALTEQLGSQADLETKLNIIPDNGIQTMTNYGNDLGNILKSNRPTEVKNELEIIAQAVKSRDLEKINELDSVITTYSQISAGLSSMQIPQTFAKAHLDMTNGMKAMVIGLKETKTLFNDPIKSLSSIKLYQDGVSVFAEAMGATTSFLKKNKIIYKQGSGGYYLLYGI